MWTQTGRPLLYTVVSRAKIRCVIIGSSYVLTEAYHKETQMTTGFNTEMRESEVRTQTN